MKTMISYEWKKIWARKITWITVAGAFLLLLFICFGNLMDEEAYAKDGTRSRGVAAIQMKKQYIKELEGKLTSEKVAEYVKEFKRLYQENGKDIDEAKKDAQFVKKYYYSYYYPRSYVYNYILYGELRFDYVGDEVDFSGKELEELTCDKEDFYKWKKQRYIKNIEENRFHFYSEKEQKLLMEHYEKNETAYEVKDQLGWQAINNNFFQCGMIVLVMCIGIAPVFNREYKTRMDAVILGTKYGKNKLIISKITVAFLYATTLFVAMELLIVCFVMLFYGADGWLLQQEQVKSYVCYLAGVYAVVLFFIGINLLLSVYCKFTTPILVFDILLLSMDMILYFVMPPTWQLHPFRYRVALLLPGNQLNGGVADILMPYSFGSVTMWAFTVEMILYVGLAVLCVPLIIRGFRRHQVR